MCRPLDELVQQAGNITPVIRSETLDDEAEELINKVSAALTTDKLIELNRLVQVEKEDPKAAAEKFRGLLYERLPLNTSCRGR